MARHILFNRARRQLEMVRHIRGRHALIVHPNAAWRVDARFPGNLDMSVETRQAVEDMSDLSPSGLPVQLSSAPEHADLPDDIMQPTEADVAPVEQPFTAQTALPADVEEVASASERVLPPRPEAPDSAVLDQRSPATATSTPDTPVDRQTPPESAAPEIQSVETLADLRTDAELTPEPASAPGSPDAAKRETAPAALPAAAEPHQPASDPAAPSAPTTPALRAETSATVPLDAALASAVLPPAPAHQPVPAAPPPVATSPASQPQPIPPAAQPTLPDKHPHPALDAAPSSEADEVVPTAPAAASVLPAPDHPTIQARHVAPAAASVTPAPDRPTIQGGHAAPEPHAAPDAFFPAQPSAPTDPHTPVTDESAPAASHVAATSHQPTSDPAAPPASTAPALHAETSAALSLASAHQPVPAAPPDERPHPATTPALSPASDEAAPTALAAASPVPMPERPAVPAGHAAPEPHAAPSTFFPAQPSPEVGAAATSTASDETEPLPAEAPVPQPKHAEPALEAPVAATSAEPPADATLPPPAAESPVVVDPGDVRADAGTAASSEQLAVPRPSPQAEPAPEAPAVAERSALSAGPSETPVPTAEQTTQLTEVHAERPSQTSVAEASRSQGEQITSTAPGVPHIAVATTEEADSAAVQAQPPAALEHTPPAPPPAAASSSPAAEQAAPTVATPSSFAAPPPPVAEQAAPTVSNTEARTTANDTDKTSPQPAPEAETRRQPLGRRVVYLPNPTHASQPSQPGPANPPDQPKRSEPISAAPSVRPSAPQPASELFTPNPDMERAPTTWARLLAEATGQPAPRPAAPAQPAALPDDDSDDPPMTQASAPNSVLSPDAHEATNPPPDVVTRPKPEAESSARPSRQAQSGPRQYTTRLSAPAGSGELFTPNPETDRVPTAWARLLAEATGQPVPGPAAVAPPARMSSEAPPVASAVPAVDPPPGSPLPVSAATEPAVPAETSSAVPAQRPRAVPSVPGPQNARPTARATSAPRVARPVPAHPAPVAPSTRQFLRPLVGIDPTSVRVHRDALADQVASSHAADAVTIDEEVFLAADTHERTPEGVGLLAHEFTHVARQRTPRFVPPLVRDMQAAPSDEEQLAERVEAQATQIARTQEAQPWQLRTGPVRREVTPFAENDAPTVTPAQPEPAGELSPWGNLPAPWEPLPNWVASTPTPASPAPDSNAFASAEPAQVSPVAPSAPAAETSGQTATGPAVQRAARDRSIDSTAADLAVPTNEALDDRTPEPDLDALARQVYAVLKRRLAAEQRRMR